MPSILYTSAKFPKYLGKEFSGLNWLNCTWERIIWSAVTVGKGEAADLTRFGRYSFHEVLYRSSIVWATLRQDGSGYLNQSGAFQALDPSEKGAISYFIGLTAAKLFADRLLDVSWLLHLDLYLKVLRPSYYGNGRTRPDLIGLSKARKRVVFEAKGRSGRLDSGVLVKAKAQVRRLKTVCGNYPDLKIALATHFQGPPGNCFGVSWEDPDDSDEDGIDVPGNEDNLLEAYYRPLLPLFSQPSLATELHMNRPFVMVPANDIGVTIGIDAQVLELLSTRRYVQVFELLTHTPDEPGALLPERTMIGTDGILVRLDARWEEANMRLEPFERS